MLISFREAADLSFQVTIAIAVVTVGTSLVAVAAKNKQSPIRAIDVSRTNLWESGPVRVDRQDQLLTITVRTPPTTKGPAANTLCSDAIGLRIACDLVAANRRPT